MQPEVKIANDLREKTRAFHTELYDFIAETQEAVAKLGLGMPDLVDMGLLCREMEVFFDEMRKEVKSRKELIGKLMAMYVAQQSLNDTEKLEVTIKGELGTGTPDVKLQPKIPEPGSPEFMDLMEYFGLPRNRLAGIEDCMRLSFNGMRDLVTDLAEKGIPMPPGVVKTWPIYTTRFRRRKRTEPKTNEE